MHFVRSTLAPQVFLFFETIKQTKVVRVKIQRKEKLRHVSAM